MLHNRQDNCDGETESHSYTYPNFLPVREVVERTSLSRSTINRLVAKGEFPKPVPLNGRKAWIEREVFDWQMEMVARR